MPRNPECKDCELYASSKNVCVWGDGPDQARIMFVGEAPGETEGRTGKPFMGASGKLLRAELDRAGINSFYITNTAKCRPPDNDAPSTSQIKACRKYLEEEIQTVNPEIIVPLGAVAYKALSKRSGIRENHGKLTDWEGRKLYPMYHPAYILRDPSHLPAFRHDLERLAGIVGGNQVYVDPDWAVVTSNNLDQFFGEFMDSPDFAFDCETTSLFPQDRKGFVRCLAIAVGGRAWTLPLNMGGFDFVEPRVQSQIMDRVFKAAEGKKAYSWNGKFDNKWLRTYYSYGFYHSCDAMLAHHLLDENDVHDLKSASRNELDAPEYEIPLKEKLNPTDIPRFLKYNAFDGAFTLRLGRKYDGKLRKDSVLRKLFYKLVMPGARVMEDVELTGMWMNIPQYEETCNTNSLRLVQLLKELREMAKKDVNWNSPQQVAKLFFTDLGLPIIEYTDGGNPSTAEATLVELKDKHPICNKLVEYREAEKFRSTYLDGWKELMVGNRIFFDYKIHGTVTGRYSSRLHQIPRDGSIRNLMEAPPGWEHGQADISQAEMRIATEYSKDPELTRCFREGIDTHWRTILYTLEQGASGDYIKPALETAEKLAGRKVPLREALQILLQAGHDTCISIWKGWKEGRKKAKGINFGFLFGMYEKKFMEYTWLNYGFRTSKHEAHVFREAFFTLYPGLLPWHSKQKRLVHLNGYVRNLAGRMRRLPGVHSTDRSLQMEAERQSINSPVQGFVGDYKVMCLIEIHETLPHEHVRIVGEHHDAILLHFRRATIHTYAPRVLSIMRHPKLLDEFGIKLSIPMEADLEIGPWGKGKKYIPREKSSKTS